MVSFIILTFLDFLGNLIIYIFFFRPLDRKRTNVHLRALRWVFYTLWPSEKTLWTKVPQGGEFHPLWTLDYSLYLSYLTTIFIKAKDIRQGYLLQKFTYQFKCKLFYLSHFDVSVFIFLLKTPLIHYQLLCQ